MVVCLFLIEAHALTIRCVSHIVLSHLPNLSDTTLTLLSCFHVTLVWSHLFWSHLYHRLLRSVS